MSDDVIGGLPCEREKIEWMGERIQRVREKR